MSPTLKILLGFAFAAAGVLLFRSGRELYGPDSELPEGIRSERNFERWVLLLTFLASALVLIGGALAGRAI